MRIEEKALDHWIKYFYGYGSWQAGIWFVAHEEGGGDLPEDVAERLTYFSQIHPASTPALCDMRELYKHITANISGPKADLFKTLHDYRFGNQAITHGGWKNLVAFTHGFNNKKLPDLSEYQKKRFTASSVPQETLINLYPLPAPHNHAWYYSWLDMPNFTFLKSRERYQEYVFNNRIRTILQNIQEHKPIVVLMYGMSNIQELKAAFQNFFPNTRFNLAKGIKQQIPQHHYARIGQTVVIITTQVPTLRHNRIETGFDWYAFGTLVSQKFNT